MDTIKIIIALLLIAGSAFAGSYRLHYNVRGSGRDISHISNWRCSRSCHPLSVTLCRCVVFHTGGTVNFKWHPTFPMGRPEAEEVAEIARRMGYVAHVESYNLSMSVGLPDSFGIGGGPVDPEDWVEYEERNEVLHSMGRMQDLPQEDELPF
jgi:hypothetical protein